MGNVVQVTNTSNKGLRGVQVTASNSAADQTASYVTGDLAAGRTAEVGWLEWNWVVEPGETVTVKANGYLPIAFSSDQLGVR